MKKAILNALCRLAVWLQPVAAAFLCVIPCGTSDDVTGIVLLSGPADRLKKLYID